MVYLNVDTDKLTQNEFPYSIYRLLHIRIVFRAEPLVQVVPPQSAFDATLGQSRSAQMMHEPADLYKHDMSDLPSRNIRHADVTTDHAPAESPCPPNEHGFHAGHSQLEGLISAFH